MQTKLRNNTYESWDGSTKIIQKNMIQDNQRIAKFAITNEAFNIKVETKWVKYPFPNKHTISDLLFLKAPTLKENKDILPIVETTSVGSYQKVALCSSYVLKNKKHIKQYLPIKNTVNNYKTMRTIPSNFTLSDGMYVYEVSPDNVLEIIEE